MENNLDKYFREQLNDRKFELKEAYWLQAQAMLEADDKRRKRKVFFWWFSGGIGAMALLMLAWWKMGMDNKPSQVETNVAIHELNEPVQPNSSIETSLGNAKQENINDKNTMAKKAISSKSNEDNMNQRTPTIKSGKRNKDANSNSTRSPFFNKTTTAINAVENDISPSLRLQNLEGLVNVENAEGLVKTEDLATKSEATLVGDLSLLPTLQVFVVGNFDKKSLATAIHPEKIEVVKKRKIQYGISLAGIARPTVQKNEKTVLGLRSGLNIIFNLNDKWHVATGLSYHYRTGSFAPSKSATQRNYRFGLELDTLLLRPTSLHYFSLPMLLGYEHNKHQLQAGILLDYLTGIRGETGSYQKQGEPPVKRFTPEKSGWVDEAGYKRLVPTAQLSYQYSLGRHWSVGLSAYYSIGGIINTSFTPPTGSFLLKETDKLSLGLQMAYRIN